MCAPQESLYFLPWLRVQHVTFLGNRWHIRPWNCSHLREDFHLFHDNSWKPFHLTGLPVSLPQSRWPAPNPQTCRFCSFLTLSVTEYSSLASSAVQRQVIVACLHGEKTPVIGIPLSAFVWLGVPQTKRIRHVDLKCYILYYSYNINIRTFISLYPQF